MHYVAARRPRRRLIVDAMNVIGSRPDGWWRDRDGAAAAADQRDCRSSRAGPAIASRSCSTAGRSPTSPKACTTACSSRTRRRGGRDAADDRIVDRSRDATRPGVADVVTSDRDLQRRVEALGAGVESASAAAQRCWNRNVRDAVVALDAERVQRHRHQVVLADREHEVEHLLLVVARPRSRGRSRRRRMRRRATRRPRASRRASNGSQPAASGPSVMRPISSSVTPDARAIDDVLRPLVRRAAPPTGAQDQQLAVARRQRRLREHVVAEHEPALHQLRVVRERAEDVQRCAVGAEQSARTRRPTRRREAAAEQWFGPSRRGA